MSHYRIQAFAPAPTGWHVYYVNDADEVAPWPLAGWLTIRRCDAQAPCSVYDGDEARCHWDEPEVVAALSDDGLVRPADEAIDMDEWVGVYGPGCEPGSRDRLAALEHARFHRKHRNARRGRGGSA